MKRPDFGNAHKTSFVCREPANTLPTKEFKAFFFAEGLPTSATLRRGSTGLNNLGNGYRHDAVGVK